MKKFHSHTLLYLHETIDLGSARSDEFVNQGRIHHGGAADDPLQGLAEVQVRRDGPDGVQHCSQRGTSGVDSWFAHVALSPGRLGLI